jgi:KUP system potassium uptake protein
LYSLLRQHANLGQKSKALSDSVKLKEQISQSSGPVHKKTLALLENFKGAQVTLFVVVMLGTCLVIGDGILTPAISGKNTVPRSQILFWPSEIALPKS